MNNKNLPLIVGIALPIIFIIVISVVIFMPSLYVTPKHNFLYTTSENQYYPYGVYKQSYTVENGVLKTIPIPQQKDVVYKGELPDLYMYDVKNDTAHKISFAEALKLSLDPGPSSPDGYNVVYNYGHDGIFEIFGSNRKRDGYVITKGRGERSIDIAVDGQYWYGSNNFKLIGWIK